MIGMIYVIYASSHDFEPMYFNEDNQLSFETIDNAARGIAYKTLGWVIKKYDLPRDDPNNMQIVCTLRDESYVGDDGKAHTLFYVNREDILKKIGQISKEWEMELRNVGGVVYLDSIMTVRENGILQGELYDNGSSSGEVYFTYEGISNARYWRNPTDLMQDYDRTVIIKPDPDEYISHPEIIQVEDCISSFHYLNGKPNVTNQASIYNDQFDVTTAIPTSETVNIAGDFSRYAYQTTYQKVTGQRTYGVKVNVKTVLVWKDINDQEKREEVNFSKWYYVNRQYKYYKLLDFELFRLNRWIFENDITGYHSLDYNEPLDIVEQRQSGVQEPKVLENIFIDEGTIYGENNYRPTVIVQDYTQEVNSLIGEFQVKSDIIRIEGEEILGDSGASFPKKETDVNLQSKNFYIEAHKDNGIHISKSFSFYRNIKDNSIEYLYPVKMNNVTVHTPVVCDSAINNSATEDRIEIGKEFFVSIKNVGQHNNIKGYGYGDYSRYVQNNQVKYPFDVYKNQVIIKKNTWVVSNQKEDIFSVAEYTTPGEYVIEFRSLALNYNRQRADFKSSHFNQYFSDYSAYCNKKIIVSGPTGEKNVKNYQIVGTH